MFGSILVSGFADDAQHLQVPQIGPEGAKEIAKSLSVTGSLTELFLYSNNLDESAKAALRAAARPALKLYL